MKTLLTQVFTLLHLHWRFCKVIHGTFCFLLHQRLQHVIREERLDRVRRSRRYVKRYSWNVFSLLPSHHLPQYVFIPSLPTRHISNHIHGEIFAPLSVSTQPQRYWRGVFTSLHPICMEGSSTSDPSTFRDCCRSRKSRRFPHVSLYHLLKFCYIQNVIHVTFYIPTFILIHSCYSCSFLRPLIHHSQRVIHAIFCPLWSHRNKNVCHGTFSSLPFPHEIPGVIHGGFLPPPVAPVILTAFYRTFLLLHPLSVALSKTFVMSRILWFLTHFIFISFFIFYF